MKLTTRIRQAARVLLRGYEAASMTGRYDWRAQISAPTTETLQAHTLAGWRAAHAVVNDPHVNAIVTAFVTDIVGDAGPSLQADDETLVRLWNAEFFANCDAEGISSLGHLLIRILRCFVIYGEAFIIFRIDADGALKLLVTPVAQIDASANEDLGDAGWVVQGIHIARDGRRIRYKVLTTPADHPFAHAAGDGTWIDAADVCHVIDPLFAGAVRGISPLSPILTRANELDQTVDARLMQQKIAALLNVIITDPSGTLTLGDMQKDGKTTDLGTGRVLIVPEGTTATAVQPPEISGADQDIKHMLRSLAAGVGLPAWKVSADLSDVNFSSARLGDHAWRRRVAALQRLLEHQVLNPIYRRWCALEVAAGRLKVDLESLPDPRWLWPAWPMVDPLAETQADALAVERGFTSISAVRAARGRDPEEVAAEIAAESSSRPSKPPTLKVVEAS